MQLNLLLFTFAPLETKFVPSGQSWHLCMPSLRPRVSKILTELSLFGYALHSFDAQPRAPSAPE
jgi:hypothetical protein